MASFLKMHFAKYLNNSKTPYDIADVLNPLIIKSKPIKVWSVPAPEFYQEDDELEIPTTVTEDF